MTRLDVSGLSIPSLHTVLSCTHVTFYSTLASSLGFIHTSTSFFSLSYSYFGFYGSPSPLLPIPHLRHVIILVWIFIHCMCHRAAANCCRKVCVFRGGCVRVCNHWAPFTSHKQIYRHATCMVLTVLFVPPCAFPTL